MRTLAVDRVYCGYPNGRPAWPFGTHMSRIAVNCAQPEVTPPRYDKARARNRRAAVLKALDGGAMLIPEICSATKDNDGYVRKVLNEFLAAGLVTKARGEKSNTLSFALTAKGRVAA